MGIPIFVGLINAFLFPYGALLTGKYALFFLMSITFFTLFSSKWRIVDFRGHLLMPEMWLGIFFASCFLPSCFWVAGRLLGLENDFLYGLFWASVCPVALVAPQFVKKRGGDESFVFSFMVLSSVVFPVFALGLGYIFFPKEIRAQFLPMISDIAFVIFVPIILAPVLRARFSDTFIQKSLFFSRWINMVLIGVLTYSYFGISLIKINFSLVSFFSFALLAGLGLTMDFGMYYLLPLLLKPLDLGRKMADSLVVALSMKNIAVAGGLLLFDFPKAAFVSCAIMVAHGFYFTYLAYLERDFAHAFVSK